MQSPVSLRLEASPRVRALVARPAVQGLATAVFFIAIVALAYWGFNLLSTSDGYTGYASSPDWSNALFDLWVIVMASTTFVAAVLALLVLPIVWGRRFGWKRVLEIISYSLLYLFVLLVISAFVLHVHTPSASPQPISCATYGGGINQDICPL